MNVTPKHFSEFTPEEWPWTRFSPREMACKGTALLMIDRDAMDRLQALRDTLGKPLIITSAYRSPEHNEDLRRRGIGAAKNSPHMRGIAFDVRMDNHDPHEFEAAARAAGFTGFGYYPRSGFMHIDTGNARSWGTPWPRSATSWPTEPPRQPETIREDREAQAAMGAGVLGGLAVAAEHLPVASTLLGSMAPVAQTIAVAAAATFIGYLIWKRTR
jgi:hypothetical protein